MSQNTFKKNFKGNEGFNDSKLNDKASIGVKRMQEIQKSVHKLFDFDVKVLNKVRD